jgi:hypothetical protein
MISSLLYDVWMTAMPMTLWTELFIQDKKSRMIDFAFLVTRGGLIRFYDNSAPGNAKNISPDLEKYGKLFSNGRYPLFYRRAASYPQGTYVYSLPVILPDIPVVTSRFFYNLWSPYYR